MNISRREVIQGTAFAATASGEQRKTTGQAARPTPLPDFSLRGEANIVDEEHFGVINGLITAGVNYHDTFALRGLFAPPYASSNFALDVRLFGEKIQARD